MSNTSLGSTMTPVEILADKVSTRSLNFDKDTLNFTAVTQDYTEHSNTKLASAYALASGIDHIESRIDGIDPEKAFLRDNTVITLPLISTNFSDTWEKLGNWFIIEGKAQFVGSSEENYLKIPSKVITSPGYYFLSIHFSRFDSGSIKIYNNNEVLIGTCDRKIGTFSQEIFVDEADTVAFSIVASGTLDDERIVIDSVGFYKVTSRMKEYMNFILSSSGVELTEEKVREIAQSTIGDSVDTLDTKITIVETKAEEHLLVHVNDKNNPHAVTPEIIGAAPKNHIHANYENIVVDIDAFNLHKSDVTGNPHHISPAMIGAALKDHTHTLDSLNAASKEHDHTGVYTTSANAKAIATDVLNEYKATLPKVDTNVYGYKPWVIDSKIDITSPLDIVTPIYHKDDTDVDEFIYLGNSDIASSIKIVNEFEVDEDNNVVVFDLNDTTTINKYKPSDILFVYNFKNQRTILGVTLYKSSLSDITGFVSGCKIYIDDSLVKEFDNETWSTLEESSVNVIDIIFDAEVTGSSIKIEVTKVVTEQNGDTETIKSNKVGMHFKVNIKDSVIEEEYLVKTIFNHYVDAYLGTKALCNISPIDTTLVLAKTIPTYISLNVSKDSTTQEITASLVSSIIPYVIIDNKENTYTELSTISHISTKEYADLIGSIFITSALSAGSTEVHTTADILDPDTVYTFPEGTTNTRVNYTFTKLTSSPRLYGYRVYFDKVSINKVDKITCIIAASDDSESSTQLDSNVHYQRYHPTKDYYECIFDTVQEGVRSMVFDITPETSDNVYSIKAVVPLLQDYFINRVSGVGDVDTIPICQVIPTKDSKDKVYFTQVPEVSTFTHFKRG